MLLLNGHVKQQREIDLPFSPNGSESSRGTVSIYTIYLHHLIYRISSEKRRILLNCSLSNKENHWLKQKEKLITPIHSLIGIVERQEESTDRYSIPLFLMSLNYRLKVVPAPVLNREHLHIREAIGVVALITPVSIVVYSNPTSIVFLLPYLFSGTSLQQ